MDNVISLPNSLANLVKRARNLSCAETAKLVRRALKEAFPEIRFSVRSHVYAGGASVHVSWLMGPTQEQVDAVAGAFRGGEFDGSQDLMKYNSSTLDGEPVHFGANFIFCHREIDREKRTEIAGMLDAAGRDNWREIFAAFGHSSRVIDYIVEYHVTEANEAAHHFLLNLPAPEFDGRRSPLAKSVTILEQH